MSKPDTLEDQEQNKITHFAYNQDNTRFSVCNEKGIHIFTTEPFELQISQKIKEVDYVEMVYKSNHVGYVTNNKMVLFDMKKQEIISEIIDYNDILGIRFTENYLCLIFENEVHIRTRKDMEKYSVIKTFKNVEALCSTSKLNDVMVVPGEKLGHVKVVFLKENSQSYEIKAHESQIQCLQLNNEGTLFASASGKGTLIRVFDTKTKKKVKEVRRGSSPEKMYSISFADDSKDICCFSSSGTAHIFNISGDGPNTTSKFRVLKYVGIPFVDSEWSKAGYKMGKEYGKIVFGKTNNVLFVVQKDGAVTRVEFENNKAPVVSKMSVHKALLPSVEQRKKEAEKIKGKFPDRLPIMLDIKKDSHLDRMKKRKFIVPKKITIGQFAYRISKKLKLPEDKSVKFHIDGTEITRLDDHIEKIYEEEKNEDGFLYISYSE